MLRTRPAASPTPAAAPPPTSWAHLVAVAEADEQHGQDLDDVRLKQSAQLVGQALEGQQRACTGADNVQCLDSVLLGSGRVRWQGRQQLSASRKGSGGSTAVGPPATKGCTPAWQQSGTHPRVRPPRSCPRWPPSERP